MSRKSNSEHICDMNDTALELFGIFLEILGFYRKAKLGGYCLYLFKPRGLLVRMIVGFCFKLSKF